MENTSVHSLADEISPLTLAFVGDGVYDLLVREYLCLLYTSPSPRDRG